MFPFAEHQLQIAFRQLLRAGDTVYDAGANRGWLTKPLADLVGPRGRVTCFEPSPRNIIELREVIRAEGLANTTLVEAALYHSSGVTLEIFENSFSNTDGLYAREEGSTTAPIASLALDDYLMVTAEPPSFVKVDVEGAEFDLLCGATELISRHRPSFILETKPGDLRPFDMLVGQGYSAYNLMTLEAVLDSCMIFDGRSIEDLLYLPDSGSAGFYGRIESDFVEQTTPASGLSVEVPIDLREGMNCIRIWGGCTVNPYEPLVIQARVGPRVVVSTMDQLILTFQPYYQCVIYADRDQAVTFHCWRQENDFTLERIAVRHVRMTAEEHRRHRTLAVTHPFGIG